MAAITEDGRVSGLIYREPELICPTCKGRSTVDKKKGYGPNTAMSYCDMHGNSWPQETCRTCHGE